MHHSLTECYNVFMFKLNIKIDSKESDIFLKEIEDRITFYLRGFVMRVAEFYMKQIRGRYSKIEDKEAGVVADNLDTVFLKIKKQPKAEKGKRRSDVKMLEQHNAGVVVHAVQRDAKEINKDQMLIKVVPNRRGFKQSSEAVFLLNRYGPWHMDYLPYIPSDDDGTILFINVNQKDVANIKKKNRSSRNIVVNRLKKLRLKISTKKDVEEQLHGYDDLEYWALRREFGLDGKKIRAWRPALRYITTEGLKKMLTKELDLYKTLTDVKFKGYKKLDKGYNIVDLNELEGLIKFQDRIRG